MQSQSKTQLTIIGLILGILMFLLPPRCSKDSTAPDSGGQPAPEELNFDGLWIGDFVFKEGDNVVRTMMASAMISPDGQTFLMVPQPDYLFNYNLGACGTLGKSNSLVNGTLDILQDGSYTNEQLEISNGKIIRTTVEDHIVYSLVADFSGGAEPFDGSGEFTLTRLDTTYNQPASLSTISGHWSYLDGDCETFVDIPTSGIFTGGNTVGCQFNGQIEVINPTKNLYQIKSWTITGCDLPWDGNYYGLASMEENSLNVVIVKQDHSFGFFMIFSKW